ncbi:MAG: DsbA family protein [Candidatus Dojkabacteria bacterium]
MSKSKNKTSDGGINISLENIGLAELVNPIAILIGGILIAAAIFYGSAELRPEASRVKTNCSETAPLSEDCLVEYAQELSLDIPRFETCLTEGEKGDQVSSEIESATSLSLTGTPTLILATGRGNEVRGFNLGAVDTIENFNELYDRVTNGSIEDAQSYWVDVQLDQLKSFRSEVRDFFKSKDGGGLKGAKLDKEVSAFMTDQKRSVEAHSELKDFPLGEGISKGEGEVVLMEFSDYECPFCAEFSAGIGNQIIEEYVNKDKLRFVFRDFPLEDIHPNARLAAEAARCAGDQEKYFEYHDLLFGIEPG